MRLLSFIKINMQRRKWYFHAAKDDIAEKNMNMLRSLSSITVGLLACLLLLAPLLIRNWTMSGYHIAFIPVAVVFCAVVWEVYESGKRSPRAVTALCAGFWVIILLFTILIDVFSNPGAQSCFMPLICIALPVSFILPMGLSFSLIGGFGALYIAGLMLVKDRIVGQYDLFCIICAFGISIVLYYYIMLMRARDYENCVKYERLSKHDTLITTLYNKQSAQSLITQYIKAHNPIESCAFMVLDVDDFKRINDTYGHHVGDLALRRVGEILLHTFDSEDIIARFGGDEFIVFKTECEDEEVIAEKCGYISNLLKLVSEKDIGVPIQCSIGAVIASNQDVDGFDGLFCQADIALYSVKNTGKGHYAIGYYDAENV